MEESVQILGVGWFHECDSYIGNVASSQLFVLFIGCIDKREGTEGELRLSGAVSWTSKDYFGLACPPALRNLGNRMGNYPMWQDANLLGPVGWGE